MADSRDDNKLELHTYSHQDNDDGEGSQPEICLSVHIFALVF